MERREAREKVSFRKCASFILLAYFARVEEKGEGGGELSQGDGSLARGKKARKAKGEVCTGGDHDALVQEAAHNGGPSGNLP